MNASSIDPAQVRKFGVVATLFFGGLLAISIWLKKPLTCFLFGFLFLWGLGFLTAPSRLTRVYRIWMRLTHVMGVAMTTVVLCLAFYLVITPAALLKRLFGGRPLPLKPDRRAATYWISRPEPLQSGDRFYKRY